MSSWYRRVSADLSNLVDCIEYFEKEADQAKYELSLKNKTIEKHSSELPGIFEHRFTQLQEIEAILEYLNIELKKKRGQTFRKFLENYQRALSSRDCEKYVDSDQAVVDMAILVNEFALVRNRFLSIIKGLDTKSFQIHNIVKLRTAGFEDAKVE